MKTLLLPLIFVMSAVSANAQSPKKINKELNAQYMVLDQRVDSLGDIYTVTFGQINSLMVVFSDRVKEIYAFEREYSDVDMKIRVQLMQLERLGVTQIAGVRSSFLDSARTHSSNASSVVSKVNASRPYGLFAFSKGLEIYPYEATLQEKNDELTRLIERRKSEIEMLIRDNQRSATYLSNMRNALLSFDTLQKELELWYPEVLKVKELTQAEWDRTKELYRKNGPKGFSEDYAQLFPDVHPKPDIPQPISVGYQVETIVEEGDIEGAPIKEYRGIEPPSVEEPAIFEVVEEPAEFPGGVAALKTYLQANLKYPESVKNGVYSGRVYVRFIVSETGEISNVKVIRGIPDCPECDAEALRVVKGMPDWKPGKNNGKVVNSWYNLPVLFK